MFFFKQKTADEMRISDWSLDVCSSDLLVLRRPEEFFRRVGDDGLIGFGEAWMTQAWDSPDLHLLLDTMAREMATLVPEPLQRLRRFWDARMPHLHRNSVDQTRDNISAHYDLSNELFAEFLDPTMSYSSGLFTCDVDAHSDHWTAGVPTSDDLRSEEHTSELQSLMRYSDAVFRLKKKKKKQI